MNVWMGLEKFPACVSRWS